MKINSRNAAYRPIPIVPRLLFSFVAMSLIAVGDAPNTLGASGDWVQQGFDEAHSGFNRFETQLNRGNVGRLTLLWESAVGSGNLYASPVVSNGKVYIGSGDGHMYAFDAATGATLWVGPQQGIVFGDSAAVGHGLVFASSLDQTMLAYNADTGQIAWSSQLTVVRVAPTLRGLALFVSQDLGTLNALNAETGRTIWSTQETCCIDSQAPTVADGRVFQKRTDTTLTAYNAQTGEQIWSILTANNGGGMPVAAKGMLFFGDSPNVIALDAATGAQLWAAPVGGGGPPPAVADRTVFMVAGGKLNALDASTGAVLWQASLSSISGPSVANGVVYASGLSGKWVAVDERNGRLLWSTTIGSGCFGDCTNSVPVIAHGVLYLAGPDNYLRAYSVPAGK